MWVPKTPSMSSTWTFAQGMVQAESAYGAVLSLRRIHSGTRAGSSAYSRGERTISVSLRHLSGRTEEIDCAPCASCFN